MSLSIVWSFYTSVLVPFPFPYSFLIVSLCLYLLETHFGISSFSHPDNALEICGLLTPLHIVPEWYFLCQYAMLKAVPNKNAGFIILLTSIFTFFFFGEITLPIPRSISLRKVHGRLNASWKISCLAVNGQSFLVIDGYLLNPSTRMMDHYMTAQGSLL